MIAKAAFGAIAGAILGLLLDPLLGVIPPVPILTQFVEGIASELLTLGFTIAGAFVSGRIVRLDHFIAKHILVMAIVASILLSASLWVNAGMPRTTAALITMVATTAVVGLLLAFCGWMVRISMQGFTSDQADEAAGLREREAIEIAEEAIRMGDPQIAVGIYSIDLAGRIGRAYATACLGIIILPPLALAISLAVVLNSHFLYGIPWLWSVLIAAIVTAAAVGLLGVSAEVGEAHAHQVPLHEKYEGILPGDDDGGARDAPSS